MTKVLDTTHNTQHTTHNKKQNGQFFTVTNPFKNDLFYKWTKLIPDLKNQTFLEPFAGANNIVQMIHALKFKNKWQCYDIAPPANNNFDLYPVVRQDVFQNFPKNIKVAITNPPYLAKNSANKDGISFPNSKYDDLYKLSLSIMLDNCEYVAAIIPESFITQNLFQNRLFGIISLTCKMFDDTDCPVCLAFFIPTKEKMQNDLDEEDFYIYKDSAYWGLYSEAKKNCIFFEIAGWKFNDPKGLIGLYAIDNQKKDSIVFVRGETIASEKIKNTSRGVTRIGNVLLNNIEDIDKIINTANLILKEYRENTSDIFLTSFRGLRQDKKYRRRLDFNQAKKILSLAIKREGLYA